MFTKATKGPEPADPGSPRKPTVASLIAEDVVFRGDVETGGDMHLDGQVQGDVKVTRLTIGETGSVTGHLQAESVDVRGRVTGSISARQVRLYATAHVDGDISHAELSIEAGAHFEGRSLVLAVASIEPQPLSVAAE